MSQHFDDSELGFVDMALKAAKGVGQAFKAIGTAVKKKKAKAKAKKAAKAAPKGKVIQMAPTDIVGDVVKTAAVTAKAKGESITPQTLTKEIASTVPLEVREQVLAAIQQNKASNLEKADHITTIASQVDEAIKPQVAALLGALQAQQISRQATHEHVELSARDNFRKETHSALAAISKRLDELTASNAQVVSSLKMGNVAIVRKNLPIFGSKNVLEG